jgi:hypothetical protein
MTDIPARDCENATSFTAYNKVLRPKNETARASMNAKKPALLRETAQRLVDPFLINLAVHFYINWLTSNYRTVIQLIISGYLR